MLVRRASIALALLTCLTLAPPGARAELSFAGIAAAGDVNSSRDRLGQRIARVVDHWSEQPPASFPLRAGSRSFSSIALAKLFAKRDVAEVNRALLAARARPYAAYGTRITIIPGLCARAGDYDFMAQDLVRLAYTNLVGPSGLWPEAARKIAFRLLPAAGTRHHERFRLGLCGRHRDSENHILMTESSRYLTNQLRQRLGPREPRYDNANNGFSPWLLRHLSRFLRRHFDEYNARPYQGYTVLALNNLHSFADDPKVARAAQLVLDYLSAVFAVQSNGLRRNPPFRRKARYANTPIAYERDPETARFSLLAGNFQFLEPLAWRAPYGGHFMLSAALGRYRVPDAILDLIVRKDRGPYYQRLHHDGVELYASSPSFLISAGGVFVRNFMFGSPEQHGWARATTVIASRDPRSDTRAFLRIRGSHRPELRNNSCVAPGFACGLNVTIPEAIPGACRLRQGPFQFLDLNAPRCPLDLGFYVAARVAACDSEACRAQADNFGVLEVQEAGALSFASFRARVLEANRRARFSSQGSSQYVSSDGRRFRFELLSGLERWPIESIDGVPQARDFTRWPLAQGDLIHASGDGLVTIDNPFLGERLVLDMRDPLRPVRRTELLELPLPQGALRAATSW